MRIAQTTKRFRKDYAKLKKSGRRNLWKLHKIMEQLVDEKTLAAIYQDHPLALRTIMQIFFDKNFFTG